MTAPALVLNSDIVAKAWVRRIPAIAALAAIPPVGLTLPKPDGKGITSWQDTGFVQVLTTGGSPHPDFPLRQPMITVFAHAMRNASKQPPWDMAGRLINDVFAAIYDETLAHASFAPVEGTRTYPLVSIVETADAVEPRPVPGDPAGYARYMFDFQMKWVAL